MGAIIGFNDLRAPDPLEGKPPWQGSQWLAAAEGWIDAECARAALTRSLSLALRIAPLARALTWDGSSRAIKGTSAPAMHAARALAALLETDPLGQH